MKKSKKNKKKLKRIKIKCKSVNNVVCNTKSKLLVYSSFIFITNALTAYYKGYYLYSCLFILLTATSIIFHLYGGLLLIIIDKIPILCIVAYGGNMLYQKLFNMNIFKIIFIVTTFLLTIFLYYYGYFTNTFCYHPDKCIRDRYHCLVHCIGSIGHHLIILL